MYVRAQIHVQRYYKSNRKTRNYVLQQCVGTATQLGSYTSSVFNYVQIPLYIWYIVH
jgi:riboflavin transporter FmnP